MGREREREIKRETHEKIHNTNTDKEIKREKQPNIWQSSVSLGEKTERQ